MRAGRLQRRTKVGHDGMKQTTAGRRERRRKAGCSARLGCCHAEAGRGHGVPARPAAATEAADGNGARGVAGGEAVQLWGSRPQALQPAAVRGRFKQSGSRRENQVAANFAHACWMHTQCDLRLHDAIARL